jgi:hypothetical protein
MVVKEQLKFQIDRLDEQYLDLAYKIICQFPHIKEKPQKKAPNSEIGIFFQEIADAGGLGIDDPKKWQQEIREDRSLPFRGA